MSEPIVSMLDVRNAIEQSWKPDTAYKYVQEDGNPALGQCYVSSRVVQHYFPEVEVVEGKVSTGKSTEKHFWNMLVVDGVEYHIDFTWQQFPSGSKVVSYKVRNRETFNDGEETQKRFTTLFDRVSQNLKTK